METSRNCGVDMPAEQVDLFRDLMTVYLRGTGYLPRPYDEKVTSFITDEMTPFRQEPILIDDGSLSSGGCPVLKVAVRGAEAENEGLYKKVLVMLSIFGMGETPNGAYSPAEGTRMVQLRKV
ncbi:MAG: hypothetical protein KJ709_00820 [Nanoarchaeota archaeon]|nr:hypothetical protein [Nanoarchaeota archaeon]